MEERRKLKRKYLAFFTRVFDESTGELLGHLADITAEGMMVISTRPIPTDQIFQLSMDLPEYLFGRDHIDFQARSIWCQPDIDPTFFSTGFQFKNISPSDVQTIEQIVKEYGIRD